jgi:hypothetical protein
MAHQFPHRLQNLAQFSFADVTFVADVHISGTMSLQLSILSLHGDSGKNTVCLSTKIEN